MAHLHSIYDTDKHFTIDPITRDITNKSSKVTLMQYDHNSERFTFEIPKMIEGHDMTLCNCVRIHFINIGNTKTNKSEGVYEVDDIQISPDSDDAIIFSWLIKRSATEYNGSLNFAIRFYCIAEDSTVDYSWGTNIFSGIKVSNGLDNSDVIVEDYIDVLEKWKNEVLSSIPPETIRKIESLDLNNMLVLRDLDSGTYVLYGKFKPYPEADSTMSFSSDILVNIIRRTNDSQVQIFYPYNNCVHYLKITDTSCERTNVYLNDLATKAENVSWSDNDPTSKGYIKDRPFYTSDPVETVLLDETEIGFSPVSEHLYVAELSNIDFNFEIGATYKVTWDGILYECIAYDLGGIGYIGSRYIVTGSDDTGEPFIAGALSGVIQIATHDSSASHAVSISGDLPEIVKIDEKYIPELPSYMSKMNPTGGGSFSLNRKADTAIGDGSFAEGHNTTASGVYSHAEGYGTTASGDTSHAEGHNTTASGVYSHAEGNNTTASSGNSHAEGCRTIASGDTSHAEGFYVKASSQYQHAQGKYNIEDTNNVYADIVGNGTSSMSRSNAYTLDWNGNGWFAGTVESDANILRSSTTDSIKKFKITVDDSGTMSTTNTDSSASKILASTEYVHNAISNISQVPSSTIDDNDKFLRVVDGVATWTTAPNDVIQYSEQALTEEQKQQARINIGAGKPQVQADWNQNDETALDYIKNRTHYDTRQTVSREFTFDGNLDGKEHIDCSNDFFGNFCYVKISDETPSKDDLIGGTISNNIPESATITDIDTPNGHITCYDTYCHIKFGNAVAYSVYSNTTMGMDGSLLTKGIWFMYLVDFGTYVSSLSYTTTSGELKKLDEKFIPNVLPTVTEADEGKILRVSSTGEWAAYTIPNAEGVSF